MSRCLAARKVTVRIRRRDGNVYSAAIVCPARWRKSTLLAYVRGEHPTATVRITGWPEDRFWTPEMWIANPSGFADYRLGRKLATAPTKHGSAVLPKDSGP